VATTPIRPKTPRPTRHSFLSLSGSAAVQQTQAATPLIRPRPAGAEPPTAARKGGRRGTDDTLLATLLPRGAMQHANTGGGERLAGARLGTSRWDRPHDGAAPRRETETERAERSRGGNAAAAQAEAEREAQIQQRRFWSSLF
jgi:hypothetical protein